MYSTVIGMSTTYRHVPTFPVDAAQVKLIPDPMYTDSIHAHCEQMEVTLKGLKGEQCVQALAHEMHMMMDFMFHQQQKVEVELAVVQANMAIAHLTLYEV